MPNLFAGMGGHQSAQARTTTWLTPPEITTELGPFDLDPCAAANWKTARKHYYKNGLQRKWFGQVWLNPPYTAVEIRQWLSKMKEHDQGVALVFARTETIHFFESVWGSAQSILFLQGRLNFHLPNGVRSPKNAGAPSVLIAYGDECSDRLSQADLRGKFVYLSNDFYAVAAIPLTWTDLVESVMESGETARLSDIYERVAGHEKTKSNKHWRDKVRQILQRGKFRAVSRGVWKFCPNGE